MFAYWTMPTVPTKLTEQGSQIKHMSGPVKLGWLERWYSQMGTAPKAHRLHAVGVGVAGLGVVKTMTTAQFVNLVISAERLLTDSIR